MTLGVLITSFALAAGADSLPAPLTTARPHSRTLALDRFDKSHTNPLGQTRGADDR